ncbi:MAG: hypothetical protein ACTSUV_03950 [Candidatus Ranarchaeia archaeon]
MNRKNVFSILFLIWMIVPVGMMGVIPKSEAQTDGAPFTDFSVSIVSDETDLVNFTAAEFMAFPNVTGWSTRTGDAKAKYEGINFTWFAITYASWSGNQSAKFIADDGFTSTLSMDQIISNSTYCYILAYKYNDVIMDNQYQLWIVPVALDEADNIEWAGNAHPRMIRTIEIIGEGAAAASTLNILIFVLVFATGVCALGLGLVAVVVKMDKSKG